MTVHDERANAVDSAAAPEARDEQLQKIWDRVVGRRAFLRNAGLATAVAAPASAILASGASATRLMRAGDQPTQGDFAILRFLCAAEIIESDLWEQYAALGGQATPDRPNDGQNGFYVSALENLDSDMPSSRSAGCRRARRRVAGPRRCSPTCRA